MRTLSAAQLGKRELRRRVAIAKQRAKLARLRAQAEELSQKLYASTYLIGDDQVHLLQHTTPRPVMETQCAMRVSGDEKCAALGRVC